MKNLSSCLALACFIIFYCNAIPSPAQALEIGIGWHTGSEENTTALGSGSSQGFRFFPQALKAVLANATRHFVGLLQSG